MRGYRKIGCSIVMKDRCYVCMLALACHKCSVEWSTKVQLYTHLLIFWTVVTVNVINSQNSPINTFLNNLDALLDLTVGRMKLKDIPPNFITLGVEMGLERFRSILRIHPEFSERLSDSDRSVLWKSNYQIAAALILLKVINPFNRLITSHNNYI